jgi:hypothetical protein
VCSLLVVDGDICGLARNGEIVYDLTQEKWTRQGEIVNHEDEWCGRMFEVKWRGSVQTTWLTAGKLNEDVPRIINEWYIRDPRRFAGLKAGKEDRGLRSAFENIKCSNEGCGVWHMRGARKTHRATCEHERVKCDTCDALVPRREIVAHTDMDHLGGVA